MSRRLQGIRRFCGFLLALAVLAGAAAGIYRIRQAEAGITLPIAPVRKGDFLVIIRCRGELRALRSVQIVAPIVPNLRIVWTADPGGPVKVGDPVIRFDSSSARQQLLEKQATLKQAQATLDQAVAQERITGEQDEHDLADARYDVERATLEASKTEIVSRLQGEESRIDLGVSQQKLKAQEAATQFHLTSSRAKIASLTRLRDQAQADVALTESRLSQMEIRAPVSGIVVFAPNYSQGWMNAKPFQVGDQAWPGGLLGEIPDLSTLDMQAKVEEIDRGRIVAGQEVIVRVDSLPELQLHATIGQISPLTEQSNEFPVTRSFVAYARMQHPDPRLRPGMNGGMDIVIRRIAGALSIPARAVFTRAGRPVVYLAEHGRYRPVSIQIEARNPDEVAISGVPAGATVALADPEKQEQHQL
ncbi:MAG TPA: efflux RND transporter periplasmic adaptor subunit [Bryobacteraceae bacterium]|nr:efflux RND transporter periplasmic adaptor subunit [Bryobacteraceae bacterium]